MVNRKYLPLRVRTSCVLLISFVCVKWYSLCDLFINHLFYSYVQINVIDTITMLFQVKPVLTDAIAYVNWWQYGFGLVRKKVENHYQKSPLILYLVLWPNVVIVPQPFPIRIHFLWHITFIHFCKLNLNI